jgi:hypothetical protein
MRGKELRNSEDTQIVLSSGSNLWVSRDFFQGFLFEAARSRQAIAHNGTNQKVFSIRGTLVGAQVVDLTRFRESSASKIVSFLEKTYWSRH